MYKIRQIKVIISTNYFIGTLNLYKMVHVNMRVQLVMLVIIDLEIRKFIRVLMVSLVEMF